MKKWKAVSTVEKDRVKSVCSRLRLIQHPGCGEVFILQEEVDVVEWKDITDECTAAIVRSMQSDGYYLAVEHKSRKIAIAGLGPAGLPKFESTTSTYRIEKAEEDRISFRILRKE